MSVTAQRSVAQDGIGGRRAAVGRLLARAVAAALALAGIIIGIPFLLWALGGALPIGPVALGPGMLVRADDGVLLLLLLLGLAWVAWAVMVASVLVEAVAALRHVPTPRLPGLAGPQRLASGLVGALVLAASLSPASAVPASATPALAEVLARVVDSAPAVPAVQAGDASRAVGESSDGASPIDRGDRGADEQLPTITTLRHDTLWLLAEQHLAAGERFAEIVALNLGVPQPDGRALGDDGRIYPGWVLTLPADAVVGASRPARHVVERGDTLWAIAESELGEGARYPEIVTVNRGDVQPGGGRLADPDLILPGWVLEIPGAASGASQGTEAAAADDTESGGIPAGGAEAGGIGPDEEAAGGLGDGGLGDGEPGDGGDGPGSEEVQRDLPLLDRAIPGPGPAPGPSAAEEGPGPVSSGPTRDRRPGGSSDRVTVPPLDRAAVAPAERAPADAAVAAAPEAAVLLPAGGTLSVLLLAAVAGELARRRRQFQRHRRPGEQIPRPTDHERALEGAARGAAAEAPGPRWEAALDELCRSARTAGRALPRVRVVRVGAELHLHLAEPAAELPPFQAVGERLWRLDPEWPGAVADRPSGSGQPGGMDPFPALVTVGAAGDEAILVDLHEIGTLQVAGTASRRPDVLRGLAAEVALGRARTGTARTLCLSGAVLPAAVEAGEVLVEPDAERVRALLGAAKAQPRTSSGDALGSLLADPTELDPVELVVADRELGVEVFGRSGAGLITAAAVREPGAILALEPAGGAVLLPEGIRLVPQQMSATSEADLVALFAATDVPDTETTTDDTTDVPTGTHVPDRAEASGRDLDGPAPDAPLPAAATQGEASDPARSTAGAPRILVLGEVRVENATGRAESTRIGRLAETAAFVLLNPDARPSALQSALWPGRRSNPQTCRQMISRTRTWLGRTDRGEPYLMPFTETAGRLRLRPEVDSDWDRFQALAGAGLADPGDLEHLTAALLLVRGRPFGPVAGRELPWADLHINEMIGLVTDVAHALACRHEEQGNWSAARDAALRGLRTESESEVLRAVLARLPGSA